MSQEKRTFKWGDQEYLLDDLLKIHAEQENNYYNFARDKGQYDDEALLGLRNAITNRINSIKNGEIFDSDGTSQSDRADNVSIQTQKRGLFKKDKYVNQDNTEWAKYYLNKLVSTLNPYQRTVQNNGWDINKHGLSAYLTGQGLNAKDIFEKLDLRDEENPDNPRSFEQRHGKLREYLTNYKQWLSGKGFDFTKNDNEWDDDFISTLDNLLNNSDWSDTTALSASLRKLGAGNQYTTAFTSDRWDLSKTDAQLKEEQQKKKEEDEIKQKADHMKEAEDYFYSRKRSSNPFYYKPYDFSEEHESFEDWYNNLSKKEQLEYGTYLGNDNQAWKNAWVNYMNALKTGSTYNDKNLGILLQGTYSNQPHGFIGLSDGSFLIKDSITDDGQGTVYNPNTGYTNTIFLGDVANQNEEIKNIYKKLAYKYANNKYGTKYEDREYVFKEGGNIIPKHEYGSEINYNWGDSKDSIKQRAKDNNEDYDIQKSRERYIRKKNKSVNNPDAGFTGAELARLTTMGADLASMFLDPITGTAVGLGSSLTNFGADIADDGLQWRDLGNLGINVGFDLLGAIPIFGDTLGTGTKIIRNAAKWAPRVMTALAAYQGVANFDGMMESWGKLLDKNAKMTVQDYRNLTQSIGLLTGGVRATRNKAAQSRMKRDALVKDVVAINVTDKKSGKVQQLLVDGKTAEAVSGGKTKEEVENILSQLEGFKDSFGENGNLSVNTKSGSWQIPYHRRTKKDGTKEWENRGFRKEGIADVNDYYDLSRVPNGYASRKGSIWSKNGFDWYKKFSNGANNIHLKTVNALNPTNPNKIDAQGIKTSAEIDAEFKKLLEDNKVDTYVENLRKDVANKNEAKKNIDTLLESEKQALTTAQDKVKNYKSQTDLEADKINLEKMIAGLPDPNKLNQASQITKSTQQKIQKLENYRKELYKTRSNDISGIENTKNTAINDNKILNKNLSYKRRTLNSKIKELNKLESEFKLKYPTKPKKGDPNWTQYQADSKILRSKRAAKQKLESDVNNELSKIQKNEEIIRNSDLNLTKVRDAYNAKFIDNAKALADLNTKLNNNKPNSDLFNSYTRTKSNIDSITKQLDDYAQIDPIQKKVDDLQHISDQHSTVHTRSYNELVKLLNQLKTTNSNIGGRDIDWDIKNILSNYQDVDNIFKQGGSINRNKLNKFLNYGKR